MTSLTHTPEGSCGRWTGRHVWRWASRQISTDPWASSCAVSPSLVARRRTPGHHHPAAPRVSSPTPTGVWFMCRSSPATCCAGGFRRIGEELLRDVLAYEASCTRPAAHALPGVGYLAKTSRGPGAADRRVRRRARGHHHRRRAGRRQGHPAPRETNHLSSGQRRSARSPPDPDRGLRPSGRLQRARVLNRHHPRQTPTWSSARSGDRHTASGSTPHRRAISSFASPSAAISNAPRPMNLIWLATGTLQAQPGSSRPPSASDPARVGGGTRLGPVDTASLTGSGTTATPTPRD